MKIGLGSPASYVFAVAFVVAPVTVALAVLLLTGGAGQSASAKPYFLGMAVLSVAPGVLYLERMRRLQMRRMGQPPGPGAADGELRLAAVGIGCFVAAECFVVAFIDWRVAAGYFALVVVWVLLWVPRGNRTILARSAVEVRCTPQAAFELVSDPNNWPLYVPELELTQPVEVPVRLGTVISDRGFAGTERSPSRPTRRSSRLNRACNLAPRFRVTPRRARESISSSPQPAAPGLSTHIDPSSRCRPRSSGSLCGARRS